MQAAVGDRIIIHGNKVGAADRHGVITEVKGHEGEPPYEVKFEDGHESLIFPGGDFTIKHAARPEG